MKKRILGIAFMAMSLLGFNAMAQTVSNSNANNAAQTEQCKKGDGQKCSKAGKKKDGKKVTCQKDGKNVTCQKDGKKGYKQRDGKELKAKKRGQNPFEGLNLTDAQKTQLQQLNASRKAARQQNEQALKAQKEQMKSQKSAGQLTAQQRAALKAEKQKNDSVRQAQRIADRQEYLVQVKEIIGPDNYVKFLENVYVQGGAKAGKSMGQGVSPKGGKQMAQNRHGKSGKGGKSI